jgi:hypothetical protein
MTAFAVGSGITTMTKGHEQTGFGEFASNLRWRAPMGWCMYSATRI